MSEHSARPGTAPDSDRSFPTIERTRFIQHRGKRLLHLDFRNMGRDMDEITEVIANTKRLISGEEPGSVLTLTDVRGSSINPSHIRAMGELVRHNTPYVRWGAVVVGLTGVYLTAFRAIQAVTRRKNLRSFSDPEEAKDWLISQP
ncbi:MAG TPA: hypothetical protein VFQ39_10515 [Longimicrobium sp.]|nr:hypothetical protein [Longimicrobium sp.]